MIGCWGRGVGLGECLLVFEVSWHVHILAWRMEAVIVWYREDKSQAHAKAIKAFATD